MYDNDCSSLRTVYKKYEYLNDNFEVSRKIFNKIYVTCVRREIDMIHWRI